MRSFLFFALILTLSTAAFAGTVTFSYGNGTTLGAVGTLNGTYNSGVFTATSGTGLFLINQSPIPFQLYPMTLVPSGGGITNVANFLFDDKVNYPPDSNGDQLDLYGLLFNVTGLGYVNLCATTQCAGDSNVGYSALTNFAGNFPLISNAVVFSTPTPEPSTLLTLGSGLIGLAGLARKRLFS